MLEPMSNAAHAQHSSRRQILIACAAALFGIVIFLATTDDAHVWPYRNTLQYKLVRRWPALVGPVWSGTGTIAGTVRDMSGNVVPFARVLVAQRDGTPWSAEADAAGRYRIVNVPAGRYVPVAGAAGHDDVAVRRAGLFRITVGADRQTLLDPVLPVQTPRSLAVPRDFRLDPVQTLRVEAPLPATAEERQIHYTVGSKPNQTAFYYTPVGGPPTLPVLLAIYPGPADTWKQVSLALAQAGYAVIAVGPAYALDLEPDVDDLLRLIAELEQGAFPRADARRLAALGGSYSSLHVFRLLERDQADLRAILLLGPPTDLFELRRQFVAGSFFPPFGLDRALIALGFPDRNPEPYWRYSARYHARSLNVPVMLIHSKIDEVVPFTQSQLLSAELDRLGKPHELHILEGMGHYLLEPKRTPAIDDLFRTTIEFFARELAAR